MKVEKPNALKDVDADTLKVYAHDATGGWMEVLPNAALVTNNMETAYHVVVSS